MIPIGEEVPRGRGQRHPVGLELDALGADGEVGEPLVAPEAGNAKLRLSKRLPELREVLPQGVRMARHEQCCDGTVC